MVMKTGFTLLLLGAVAFMAALTATDLKDGTHPEWAALVGSGGLCMLGAGLIIAGIGGIWGI